MDKSFINLVLGVFVLWNIAFCGFWYFHEMTRAALFACITVITFMLMLFEPQSNKLDTEEDNHLKKIKKDCKDKGLSLKVYKKVNGKWVQK